MLSTPEAPSMCALAVRAVRTRRARHRDGAPDMWQIVELGLEIRQRGTALARALGVARLRHETVDHPVKQQPVVKALAGKRLYPLDMGGRLVGREGNQAPPAGGKFQVRNFSGLGGRGADGACAGGSGSGFAKAGGGLEHPASPRNTFRLLLPGASCCRDRKSNS